MIKQKKDERRVVVTGLGVVSSIGIGWQEFWKNLLAGKSGISKITSFDTSSYDRHYGGEVKDFNPYKFIDKRKADRMGRASQMAIASCNLALSDADFSFARVGRRKVGVFIGTTTGEIARLEQYYKTWHSTNKKIPVPMNLITFPTYCLSSHVSRYFRLSGPSVVFSNACAAGNYAIGYAYDLIKNGRIELAIAGGVDGISNIVFTGFSRLLAIAPEKCQPFDKDRKGMIPGEGSGILFLENLDSALKRKARIYAEIYGYGLSCDGHHMTSPSPDGVVLSIKKCLDASGVCCDAVDYVSAHGTGTIENDRLECQAIKTIFGARRRKIPVSSIKSMIGHCMGASSAIEAITCCLAIKDQKIPPTIGFNEKDPDCDIDCVPNKSREAKVGVVLNNSLAFGGNNASLLLGKRK
ncbi:MAG TPA: beta-ketoacyl-[acyl-carrier-protein] synthase family protein [Candidatus Omnitrophota bacterium]|mgnify:CR=1 FL=1|nr:beta-ketoacyl-[acyl-carrier-protein] synthase family protein [Candidatus Omnitrophota bacterium]HQL41027.1 beta-ketoacyl-[acyl-carrier-protein] synthase family protein [Candidatus Omnitrophota bacterium]